MPETVNESNLYKQLRDKAVAHLQTGKAPTGGQWSLGIDALRLLHQLSSHPDHADDALKLLHELQVHQVELDLQNEEIAANEQAIEDDLSLYRTLYDSAPIAYFVVDVEGKIIQGNLAAAELFGIGQDDMEGQRIDTFLEPQDRPQLFGLLQRVAESGTRDSCVAETTRGTPGSQHLQFLAGLSPEHEHLLLTCCESASAE